MAGSGGTLPDCPPHIAREAAEALAVHHEHRVRDLPRARSFAVRSLAYEHGHCARTALRYRLARLDRKMEVSGPERLDW